MVDTSGTLWGRTTGGYSELVAIRVPASPGPSHRSANMRANRRRDTGPERAVRSLLHARGLRYRVDLPIRVGDMRPVRPDLVFTKPQICCFIDGCWWHGCPEHGRRRTSSNDDYWRAKIARNIERDAEQEAALTAAGWIVLRFWEHQDPEHVATTIGSALRRREVDMLDHNAWPQTDSAAPSSRAFAQALTREPPVR